jgi:D-galactarolactone cycloisomerase
MVKIREVRVVGLRGATPEGGWTDELQPDDCVHTLVAVHTDEGVVGVGSVFTTDALVRAALEVLEPLYRGENALEPERVSEKLRQNTFWLGRGGSITHAISGIDIAGTSWAKSAASRSAGCWAGATASACAPTPRF